MIISSKFYEKKNKQSKGVLINFAKFRGKHLCHSLLYSNAAGLKITYFYRAPLAAAFECLKCSEIMNSFCEKRNERMRLR